MINKTSAIPRPFKSIEASLYNENDKRVLNALLKHLKKLNKDNKEASVVSIKITGFTVEIFTLRNEYGTFKANQYPVIYVDKDQVSNLNYDKRTMNYRIEHEMEYDYVTNSYSNSGDVFAKQMGMGKVKIKWNGVKVVPISTGI